MRIRTTTTHVSRRLIIAASTAAVAVTLGAAPTKADDPAAPSDYWILAGDQASDQLLAFDPAASDWNDPGAVMWSWTPTQANGFTAAEITAFGGVTDFKLRNTPAGQRIALTASNGLAAVISYPAGVKQWAQIVPASHNLHSAELLPNGNVAVTSTNTTSGYVRVYAASQGPNASNFAQYSLNAQSHGVLWDPTMERLWIIGKEGSAQDDPRIITALAVTGSDAEPRLTHDDRKWHELPDIGSHDLTPDPNDPHRLLISTDAHTYEFDKTASSGAFTEMATADGGLPKVKATSRQPSGQIVQTRPDLYKTPPGGCAATNYWCTDTVDFYGPDMTRTRTGAQFYRARVMNPAYNAVGDTVHGPVYDRVQPDGEAWSPATQIDSNDAVGDVTAAALPDGTMHVQTLVPGVGVWDRERSASGTWSSSAQIDSNDAITDISAAASPDGTLHVQTLIPGHGVWNRTRDASGAWSSATKIDANGDVRDVSAAVLPDGTVHVQTLIPGSGVWDRTRNLSGVWSSAIKIADGCEGTAANDACIESISVASLPNGTLHLQSLVPGIGVYDLSRSSGGTWSEPMLIDGNDAITRISSAGAPDGTLHVQTVVPGYGLWDRERSPEGAWSGAAKLDATKTIFSVYGSALPNGDVHVGHAAYIS